LKIEEEFLNFPLIIKKQGTSVGTFEGIVEIP
jgi:hypothetical protein